ncbi:MAG: carbohydrate-binding family 9-like protein [Gemmatimonadota bacterium]|nr:carbohydrate-binding family 9-like protein [Gemmatimonadota bacterium]MDH4347709.1 carbohydrate-binding family 9-like protein [Gemmatimonadota bacterium]MDH5282656.1 carbohydrate-binding family 9-like protein [Gemmatimonadota bacterium]
MILRPAGIGLALLLSAPARLAGQVAPARYVAEAAARPIVVDGRLDDAAWGGAAWSADFTDIEGDSRPAPRWRTRVKLLWDSTALYVGAELEEPDLWATLTRRDAVIYHDNDFEVFLDPDGDGLAYFELEINALGTVWDLFLPRPYRLGGSAVDEWDIAGLRSAVALQGTLNHPVDRDAGWTVELAIPFTALTASGVSTPAPADGTRWRVNFSRVEWDLEVIDGEYRKPTDPASGQPRREHNWVWSPQGVVDMHRPEQWGTVEFRAADGSDR